MTPDQDWSSISAESGNSIGGTGTLRLAIVFGSVAIAFALFVAPLAERQAARQFANDPAGVDMMSTGSISRDGQKGNYTIRRSVLQTDPNAVCIIRPNGVQSGQC